MYFKLTIPIFGKKVYEKNTFFRPIVPIAAISYRVPVLTNFDHTIFSKIKLTKTKKYI